VAGLAELGGADTPVRSRQSARPAPLQQRKGGVASLRRPAPLRNPCEAVPTGSNSLILRDVEFPSHGRGRRFNPYSAHHENPLKSKPLRRGDAGTFGNSIRNDTRTQRVDARKSDDLNIRSTGHPDFDGAVSDWRLLGKETDSDQLGRCMSAARPICYWFWRSAC
jgi:hypothetical protein